ncbi:uncharacterized protein I206_101109 [Kwoniella pini CBS 10737]|uniref:WSC domain-containing protein n=1 Tax=Kwoniella pini CBS 10737 TaxID=1296096 RepID=A0A1B9IBJ7_9TREE|nr:uncharacterized protein I206_00217 [Kwoniella pini CBS 10737]OCF52916.1 hypothetical protein I206_00217 [Kwoniella pini CBS 10737]
MLIKQLLGFISLFNVIYAQSFIGCVDNIPSDTTNVEVQGDCDSTCKSLGYEYSFWSVFEKDCECGNSPPKTFMYNVAQNEYGICLPYDHAVTKIHSTFQFHLCTKTIELPSTSIIKSKTSIVNTMSECFDSCPEADYVGIAPQWVKGTYECKCGGMPKSYLPVICAEGTVYGYSNPSSKGNRRKSKGKAVAGAAAKAKAKAKAKPIPVGAGKGGNKKVKPQRLGKQQQVEQTIPVKGYGSGEKEINRYDGL